MNSAADVVLMGAERKEDRMGGREDGRKDEREEGRRDKREGA